MPDLRLLAVFALATFVLTATPGPGVLYVVGRSVGGGRRTGLASMLGIETGEAVYIVGAALGITALLATRRSRCPCCATAARRTSSCWGSGPGVRAGTVRGLMPKLTTAPPGAGIGVLTR